MTRKSLFFLALAGLILGAYLLAGKSFDRELFLESMSDIRPLWTGAAIAVTFICYVIRAFRWQVLLISLKRIGLASLLSTTILGFGAIYILGRAGEFVRPVWIARREGIPVSGAVATIAAERVFDVLMLVLLSAVSLVLVELPGDSTTLSMLPSLLLLLAGAALALVVFIFLRDPAVRMAKRLPVPWIGRIAESFGRGLAATSEGHSFGAIALSSILLWSLLSLQFWLMLVGLNLDLGLSGAMLVLVFTCLGSLAQIPGIGGGFQAALAFSLTAFFSIQAEVAIAAALMVWLISYAPTLMVSAVYMAWRGISTRELIVEVDSAAA